MLQDGTPQYNPGTDPNRLYEQAGASPTIFNGFQEHQKLSVTKTAWMCYVDGEVHESDVDDPLHVLRLAWQVPRCRAWIQDRQQELFWDRSRRQTFEQELVSPELHWRQRGEDAGGDPSNHGVVLSSATAKVPQWLLEPWLRRGKLHSLEGKKGVGKSQLSLWLAKQIFARESKGKVLIFSREDDLEEDILPRAMALGADLDRLVVYQDDVTFADTTEICARAQHHDAVLMVFDTLQKYIADKKADMNSAFGAQGQITPLEEIVQRTGCAALVVRHTRKGRVEDAAEAGLGSQAIGGAMRSILTAGRLEAEGEYGLSLAVGNYAAGGGGMVYRLTPTHVMVSNGMARTTHVEVLRDDPELNADKLTSGAQDGHSQEGDTVSAAKDLLRDLLSDGPQRVKDILAAGREAENPIGRNSLYAAAADLGVEKRREPVSGQPKPKWPYVWELPPMVPGTGNHREASETRINTGRKMVTDGYRPSGSIGENMSSLDSDSDWDKMLAEAIAREDADKSGEAWFTTLPADSHANSFEYHVWSAFERWCDEKGVECDDPSVAAERQQVDDIIRSLRCKPHLNGASDAAIG